MASTVDSFLWNAHTAIVEKTKVPGSEEDQRFLALALCGEAGELANLVKKQWRGDTDPAFKTKLADELGDVYAYLRLNAIAHGMDLDTILETITLPKIKARWGNDVGRNK
jgi:NTP pyrophosphatase (non-canonical NTP hydrolase)